MSRVSDVSLTLAALSVGVSVPLWLFALDPAPSLPLYIEEPLLAHTEPPPKQPLCWVVPVAFGNSSNFLELMERPWPPVVCGGHNTEASEYRCYRLQPENDAEKCSVDSHWTDRLRP